MGSGNQWVPLVILEKHMREEKHPNQNSYARGEELKFFTRGNIQLENFSLHPRHQEVEEVVQWRRNVSEKEEAKLGKDESF